MPSAASVPCKVWRPSEAKVSTPSAALPSSSMSTAESAMLPPTTLVFAFSEKRPKPPPGSCLCAAQRTASRSEVESAETVPSIFSVGPRAELAFEDELERRAGQPQLDAGRLAVERRDEIVDAEVGFDLLAAPVEAAGGGEAAEHGRPGERAFDIGDGFRHGARVVADDHGAVVDADFREGGGALRGSGEAPRSACRRAASSSTCRPARGSRSRWDAPA